MLSCGNFYIYLLNGSLYNNSIVYDSSNRLPKPIGPFCFNSFKCTKQHQKLIHSAARTRLIQSISVSSSSFNSDDQLSAEIQIQNNNGLVDFQLFTDLSTISSFTNKLELEEPFLEFILSKSNVLSPLSTDSEFTTAINNVFVPNNISTDISHKKSIESLSIHESNLYMDIYLLKFQSK